jgi:XisH protein
MAKDIYHDSVRHALEKENWKISSDPLSFKVGEVSFRIDLAAEKMILAERENVKIAVEIKSFIEQSPLHAFHEAMGQYDNYLFALEEYEPDRILYLAVPIEAYYDFFQKPFIQKVLNRKAIKLIVYDPQFEKIDTWIR